MKLRACGVVLAAAACIMAWRGEGRPGWAGHAKGAASARTATSAGNPRLPAGKGVALVMPWGLMPPAGTSSAAPWHGTDSDGKPVSIEAYNCWEAVNFFTSGNRSDPGYRQWPAVRLAGLDAAATWAKLEESLCVGDVVEFVAHWRGADGAEEQTLFHVQICVGKGGIMGGANNEPRFELVHGVPTQTHRWDVCTSRAYYEALRGMDLAWEKLGRRMEYAVVVYRRSELAGDWR